MQIRTSVKQLIVTLAWFWKQPSQSLIMTSRQLSQVPATLHALIKILFVPPVFQVCDEVYDERHKAEKQSEWENKEMERAAFHVSKLTSQLYI